MRTIIAGSREVHCYSAVEAAILRSGFKITEVICGKARGVDSVGEQWGINNHIPIKSFPVKSWYVNGKFDKSQGMKRNIRMGNYGDALIALPCPKSRGTLQMIKYAISRGLKVYVSKVWYSYVGKCWVVDDHYWRNMVVNVNLSSPFADII